MSHAGSGSRKANNHVPGAAQPRSGALQTRTVRTPCVGWSKLDASKQRQDHDDDQDCAEKAAWSIAPAGAIPPGWKGADQKKNEHDDEDGGEHLRFPYARTDI